MKKRMNRYKTVKKNNFVQGAFIATLGIVLSKVMGILYVIPFYMVIGEQGGALYGYAYSIYLLFMAISSAGIPLAISKIISEYQTLGYYDAKKRAFILGKKMSLILGLICFITLFIFAPNISRLILGDLTGGNTIEDVTYVIRVISTAILIVPVLSVYRGYFEGHKFITPPSVSQVLEQIVRVTIIIVGSFLTLKVFNLSLKNTVGVAVFGATLGSFFSYFYLLIIRNKNKNKFTKKILDVKEPKITDKQILRKIIIYAFPLVMIDIFKSLYSVVDTFTVVKALGPIYGTIQAEAIMSILSTWAAKFNMIIISISTGMIISLIPNLTSAYVTNNMDDVHKKINQSFQMLIFLILPMTVGLSFLAEPIYTLFYGASKYGQSVLSLYIFVAFITALFTTSATICQVLRYYKAVVLSLISGLLLKVLINVSLINEFYSLGLPAYYGPIVASILGYTLSFIICLIVINKKTNIKYEKTINQVINALCGTIIMIISLLLVKLLIPISSSIRFINLFIIVIYTLIGGVVYILYMNKTNSIKEIYGNNFLKRN